MWSCWLSERAQLCFSLVDIFCSQADGVGGGGELVTLVVLPVAGGDGFHPALYLKS